MPQEPDATPPPAPAAAPAIKGVFSTETVTTLGFGATKRRVKQTVYVLAEETPEGMVSCQPLSAAFIPLEGARVISKDDLFKNFVPAPHIYLSKVLPALKSVEQAVDNGDRCRGEGQFFSAEFEYKNALRLDENHIRASFGLGLTYMERGETENAGIVFRKLSTLKGAFTPEYKHLFNEFGISLRKQGMLSEAVRHYSKAYKLSPTDEHLLCNLARALYEKGKIVAAKRVLEKALALRPDFAVALKFKRYIDARNRATILDDHTITGQDGGKPETT